MDQLQSKPTKKCFRGYKALEAVEDLLPTAQGLRQDSSHLYIQVHKHNSCNGQKL